MEGFSKRCFVCQKEIIIENKEINLEVNLPVCQNCKGTKKEKHAIENHLDSLADGLVCGCI